MRGAGNGEEEIGQFKARWAVPVSLGLVSFSVIAFQLVIMRLLSISQWHHFAYMVISMAMLGFGAAGTVLSLFRRALTRRYTTLVPLLYVLTGATIPLAVRVAAAAGNFDTFLLFFDQAQITLLVISYLAYAFPFFCAGLAVTLAFACEVRRIARLYFANLVGSGVGALSIIALLWVLPLERQAPVIALLPLAAGWITLPGPGRPRRLVAALACVAVLSIAAGLIRPVEIRPSQYKAVSSALQLPDVETVHRSDTPYGRIEVLSSPAQRFTAGFSLFFREEPPVRDVMFVDGNYYGTLLGRGLTASSRHILDTTTQALPYAVRPPARALVLGAATGTAVSHALSQGAAAVSAVEPNRRALHLLTEENPDWIDALYQDPRVRLYGESSRSYLSGSSSGGYDLIVTPVLGAFGGETGVTSLSERYDLTLESFEQMWELLEPEGMIACTVWADTPPRVLLRVLATWRALLAGQGIAEAERHIAAVRSWATVTVILSRCTLDGDELEAVRSFASGLGFDPLILPGLEAGERDRYNRLPDTELFDAVDTLVKGDPESLYRDHLFDVAPVVDDRPFFSRFIKVSQLRRLADIYGVRTVPYLELGTVLAGVTFLQIAAAAALLVVAPLLTLGWKSKGRGITFLIFSGLGIGFMFFEIVLIQHLVLYLGQPVYATAAVLAVLLVASGVGSLLSRRIRGKRYALAVVGVLIAALIGLYALLLMPVVKLTIAWPPAVKLPIMFLLLATPALGMGMMFPLALGRLSVSNPIHIPWACAIDSALSVTATAAATLLALGAGFASVLAVSAAAYLVSALVSLRLRR